MACKTVKYVNQTASPICYTKGLAGVPWPGCDAEPGGVIDVPDAPGYHRMALEAGFTLVTPDIQAQVDEEVQLRAMIADDEQKAAPVPVVEETAPVPPTGDPEPTPVSAPAPVVPEVKRRGRRN